uniref:Uncharacterized protein n=1 Tax=Lactuca sativa TaxID=4236 RepID=A0A9R1XWD8_LACSA|nr:hypothetical protein LSAT_V11C100020090 [Lactuca sativa]
MCKHRKWDLELDHDATRSRPEHEVDDEESGGSTKRSRSTEEGDYCVQSNTEGASIGGSIIKCPTGRDAAKRKEKFSVCFIFNMLLMYLAIIIILLDAKLSLSSLLNARLSLSSFRDTTLFRYNLIIQKNMSLSYEYKIL